MTETTYTTLKGRTEAETTQASVLPASYSGPLVHKRTVYSKFCGEAGTSAEEMGRGSRLEIRDEGSTVLAEPYYIDFVGSMVASVTPDSTGATVTISSPPTSITGFIEAPLVKAYPLLSDAYHTWDITKITGKTSSGTCDFAVKIDGTTVTGMSGTFTSTEGSFSASGSNSVAVGERVTLDIPSVSSPADLEFTMVSQRTST